MGEDSSAVVPSQNNDNSKDPKRKRKADSLGRIAATTAKSQKTEHHLLLKTGRGSVTGWTTCPLCSTSSNKRFALGRGIASHLHALHTPWKPPGKAERNQKRRDYERALALWNRFEDDDDENENEDKNKPPPPEPPKPFEPWEPTQQDRDAWEERVLQIVTDLEEKAAANAAGVNDGNNIGVDFVQAGLDRTGKKIVAKYRDSLPPFLQAAADGNLKLLQQMVAQKQDEDVSVLLDTRDRHLSCAEHWAAGGGHLDCLKYLCELRNQQSSSCNESKNARSVHRRRDGKTCLHYAARNGQLECIKYLIQDQKCPVDEASGDGTTPLHLACLGGHVESVKYLVKEAGANVHICNEWGCSVAHWAAMSSNFDSSLCEWLQAQGISFVKRQKQGHGPLHKAAQRRNHGFIEWLMSSKAGLTKDDIQEAGMPDDGGHTPSGILESVGGDGIIVKRMKDQCGW